MGRSYIMHVVMTNSHESLARNPQWKRPLERPRFICEG